MTRSHTRKVARPHLGGEVRHTVLPSGLRVITEDVPGSLTQAMGVFVDVGTRQESAKVQGCAHFLEHLLFKGTPTRTAAEISGAFDRIGGEVNAFTSKEYTCYHAKVLADDADGAMVVLQDMVTNSVISASDVEDERTVILDEIAMHLDDPMESAYHVLASHLYGDHPLGRSVIGPRDSIAGLTRTQISRFYRHHYVPSDLVVAVAGRVDHEAIVERWASLGGEPISRRPLRAPAEPASGAVSLRTRPLEQVSCVLGFPGVPQMHPDQFALGLLVMILGGGMSSRLFQEIREKRGLTYHVDAGAGSYRDAGQITIEWFSAPGLVAPIVELIAMVIGDVIANGVTDEELARAKGQVRGHTLLAFEAPEVRMMRLGRRELMADPLMMDDILDAFEAVTGEQVRAAATRYLSDHATFVGVGPKVNRHSVERVVQGWTSRVAG